jgi:broad specificity phosphatase PhoE
MPTNTLTTISFIRHGQVYNPEKLIYGRLPGFGLSDMGKRQVEGTADYLKQISLAAIYSSPLLRARQTADLIHHYHRQLSIKTASPINEVRFQFEGQPMENMKARNWDLYTGVSPDFEQPIDIVNRVKPFLYDLREQYPGKHIALVTHGDVIAFTLLWLYKRALIPQNKHTLDSIGLADDYPAPASITNLIYSTSSRGEIPRLQYVKPYDASLEDQGVSPR